MFRKIVQVAPDKDYTITVYFADGKITKYNIVHL